MIRATLLGMLLLGITTSASMGKTLGRKHAEPSAIDRYIADAEAHQAAPGQLASPGSLYTTNGLLANTSRDLRGAQVDDIVTIVVSDQASAVSKGGTNSARKSSMKAGVSSGFAPPAVAAKQAHGAVVPGPGEPPCRGPSPHAAARVHFADGPAHSEHRPAGAANWWRRRAPSNRRYRFNALLH